MAEPYPVSARMIYECARLKRDAGADDGVSLRDVIKGFYNYGVCRDALWPYAAGGEPGQLSIERARDAKNLSLGAYYRLRPNLNTYHAALHETGALLVSAELHDGWRHDRVRAADGAIVPPRPGQAARRPRRRAPRLRRPRLHPAGLPRAQLLGPRLGRLGARPARRRSPASPSGATTTGPTPSWTAGCSASASARRRPSNSPIGDQGLGFGAEAPVRSTPVHAILGNFLHLDDGDFVASGAFVSTRRTLEETQRLLEEDAATPKPYQGVLLTFAGGLTGLRDATDHVARWKRPVRDAGWYPFTVLWCVDYVEQARPSSKASSPRPASAPAAPGPASTGWSRSSPTASAARSGATSAAPPSAPRARGGPLHDLARAGAGLAAKRPGFGLRIVAESEGAIALAALLRAMRTEPFAAEAGPFFEMLESVDLVAPPLDAAEFAALAARPRRRLDARRARTGASCVHLPDARDEKRLAVPPYGLSYFELVRRAFAGRADGAARPRRPAVAAEGRASPRPGTPGARAPRAELVPIAWPPRRRARRPGADQPDPARLPLRRGRPAQGDPAPPPAASSAKARRNLRGAAAMPKADTSRITVDELGRKLSDLSIPEEELAKYFQLDEDGLDPDQRPSSSSTPRRSRSRPRPTSRAAPARRSSSTAPTSSASCAARRASSRSSTAAPTRAR